MEKTCKTCDKQFATKSGLKRHLSYIHGDPPPKSQDSFICWQCGKQFRQKYNLSRHIKNCQSPKKREIIRYIECFFCSYSSTSKDDVLRHYNSSHNINISMKKLEFKDFSAFEAWKDQVERDTCARYTRRDPQKRKSKTMYYYKCHRDGFYTSRGKNIRRLKLSGSNKIGGHCPAKIRASHSLATGKISVEFLPTHVGHSMDLSKIPLKKSERDEIAAKLKQKIPFDEILDNIRYTSDEKGCKRINLLTRKDLYNIELTYNIKDQCIRRINECENLDLWVKELQENNIQSVVRYYKGQGQEDYTYKLDKKDFLLIIMNEAQLGVLKRHKTNPFCVDSANKLNSRDFELISVSVLDNLRQGLPCLFAFSNRSDKTVFKIIFSVLKKNLNDEEFLPNIFMSSDSFYSAWCEIMGPVETKLFCSWHIKKVWEEKVVHKVSDANKQNAVKAILEMFLKEPDKNAFETNLAKSLTDFKSDPELNDFGLYFDDNFVPNRQAWAPCYMQGLGMEMIMHVERMHKTLDSIYRKCRSGKRLVKTVNSVMNMVRIKLYEPLLVLSKGKTCEDHKVMDESLNNEISLLTVEDGTWTISSSQANETFTIRTLNKNCTCGMMCFECKTCIHSYVCTCSDSSVRWKMCIHIHHLCARLENTLPALVTDTQPNIQCNENSNSNFDCNEVGDGNSSNDRRDDGNSNRTRVNEIGLLNKKRRSRDCVRQRKDKIRASLESYLKLATTSEHLRVLEDAMHYVGRKFEEYDQKPHSSNSIELFTCVKNECQDCAQVS